MTPDNDAVTIFDPMTRAEAESHVQAINHTAADMGRHLLELKDRQGWQALGYATWTDCLEYEFHYSRKHLYELMAAAPVLERLLPEGNALSTKAAAALAHFDVDLQAVILRTAQARYDRLTESNLTRVGAVVETMARTGHVDTGNGSSTPVDGALAAEDEEAIKRKKQYIAENGGRMVDPTTGEIIQQTPPRFLFKFDDVAHVPSGFTTPEILMSQAHKLVSVDLIAGQRYLVKVYAL